MAGCGTARVVYGFSVVLGAVAGLGKGLMLGPKDGHCIDWSRLVPSCTLLEGHGFFGLALRHAIHYRLLLIVKLDGEGHEAQAAKKWYWWNGGYQSHEEVHPLEPADCS